MAHIEKRNPADVLDHMAELEDRAAAAFASELSSQRDPVLRERLGTKMRRAQQNAEFHRAKAAELRTMGDDHGE